MSYTRMLSVQKTLALYGIITEQSLDECLDCPAQTSETAKPARKRRTAPRVSVG
ncbi:MAG: hypothetical protein NT023_25345 [Armatimonadetes bacterium]|nr:hypothetical protein [Armatimonadota bacterium]